jgi:hypothetical protein
MSDKPKENSFPRLTSRLALQGISPRPACIHDPAGLLETCDICGASRGVNVKSGN